MALRLTLFFYFVIIDITKKSVLFRKETVMEGFMEIIARGFDFSDLSSYLQIATGQTTVDSLFGSFFEGLKVFIENYIMPLFA